MVRLLRSRLAAPWLVSGLLFLAGCAAFAPLHDVSTDLADPPVFLAILPLRANASNPATHGGEATAKLQRELYPDLAPLDLSIPPEQAFERAVGAATALGWVLAAADPKTGRIEATASTPWFHFKDDVVVRIRPRGIGSRVDVRSASRLGGSDLGTNARRIRAYMALVSHGP